MCTAITLKTRDFYFGRTLDIDVSYGESVCIIPRKYPFEFRKTGELSKHYAIIGMATLIDGVPLFYDAANEHGLCMAGLNFPHNAYYYPEKVGKENVASFEFIPWILCRCRTVEEARKSLLCINIADIPFSKAVLPAPLHWIIADKNSLIVVECMQGGMHIYDNPAGVLTNNPPFSEQLKNLDNYKHLRVDNKDNVLGKSIEPEAYCQGLGAVGLPGDVSSKSRFVRAAFGRAHSVCGGDEKSSVNQFFHLLSSVQMIRGLCKTDSGTWDISLYSSCINADRGLYYYKTYDDFEIKCIDMHTINLDGNTLKSINIFV